MCEQEVRTISKTVLFMDSWAVVCAATTALIARLQPLFRSADIVCDYSTALSEARRKDIMEKFMSGDCRILVCTERGWGLMSLMFCEWYNGLCHASIISLTSGKEQVAVGVIEMSLGLLSFIITRLSEFAVFQIAQDIHPRCIGSQHRVPEAGSHYKIFEDLSLETLYWRSQAYPQESSMKL